jgi:ParB/RepB/Spo0J family partition protein
MATTTERSTGVTVIALQEIRTDQNVRQQLNIDEVDALAKSIALLGQLTPASVRPDGDGYLMIAGHKRYAALKQLGRTEIRAEIRDSDEHEQSERAAENIVRSSLNPYEEARAVQAMLDRGLTEDGAAQALGWPKARIAARVKLLALPERAQQLIGAGTIALSSVDQLRAIGTVSPPLLDALIGFLADGNEWAAGRLSREPGWVLDSALREAGNTKVFAEHLSQLHPHTIQGLKLGKKTDELLVEATVLAKKIDRHAYGAPAIRFTDGDVDQARAAGVVIEFENAAPIIVDRPLFRELAKGAIKRTVAELQVKVAEREAEKKVSRRTAGGQEAMPDPVADARREEQRQLRDLAEQAHGVNLDLGASLLNGLSTVDATDLSVARFFVYATFGADWTGSGYGQAGEQVARLAATGIRLVIGEFRTDVTKTKKDGSKGKLRVDYGDHREPKDPVAWMWKFVDGGQTAGELYGRALVVIAAEQYASRLVVPTSQRSLPTRWSSHKDHAAKALKKLAGPHLPASLKQLERAIDRAHKTAATASQIRSSQPAPQRDAAVDADVDPEIATDETVDDALDGDLDR